MYYCTIHPSRGHDCFILYIDIILIYCIKRLYIPLILLRSSFPSPMPMQNTKYIIQYNHR
jgi:hypothetical protein